ncbi:MAG: hypothetical protein GF418_07325 [Chitinivibrionales bacterium]|nr:hypothetical protein [Chitinivibrionales bacterium]MBD3395422.1 hypothetical protein [Chitinivibrionales bacterium]
MPHTYSISESERLVRVVCDGPGDLEEGAGLLARVAEDPCFAEGFGILVDVRTCVATMGSADVHAFIEFLKTIKRLKSSRIAVVTANDLYYAFGRMMNILGGLGGISLRPFRSMSDARVWLGLAQRAAGAQA